MPQQSQADLGGGGESRGAGRSRQKSSERLEIVTAPPPPPAYHWPALRAPPGSSVLHEITKGSHYITDGPNIRAVDEDSEKRVKTESYCKDRVSTFHQNKQENAPTGQGIKLPKNLPTSKWNRDNISKISEAKVFVGRSKDTRPRLTEKSTYKVLNTNSTISAGFQAKRTSASNSTVTSGVLNGNIKSMKAGNSNSTNQKVSGKLAGPVPNCQGWSLSAKHKTVKSSTDVSLRTSQVKSRDNSNTKQKSKTPDISRNMPQTSEEHKHSFERSNILIRAQMLNQHLEKMDSSEVAGKGDPQLPPVKLLKTPSVMHELVNRVLLSNLADEPVQIKRRNFVKLPPLSKKRDVVDSTLTTQRFVAGRRLYTDRKPVNKPKIVGSKGKTDSKPNSDSKEVKPQLPKNNAGKWK